MRVDWHGVLGTAKLVALIALAIALVGGLCVALGLLVNWWFAGSTTAMVVVLIVLWAWRQFRFGRPR